MTFFPHIKLTRIAIYAPWQKPLTYELDDDTYIWQCIGVSSNVISPEGASEGHLKLVTSEHPECNQPNLISDPQAHVTALAVRDLSSLYFALGAEKASTSAVVPCDVLEAWCRFRYVADCCRARELRGRVLYRTSNDIFRPSSSE